MYNILRMTFGLMVSISFFLSNVNAGDEVFCKNYAHSAVTQFTTGRDAKLNGIVPPAWSDNYSGHYTWCMVVPKHIATTEESKRQDYLNKEFAKIGKSESTNSNNNAGYIPMIPTMPTYVMGQDYQGCFKDQGDPRGLSGRDLSGYKLQNASMTSQMCRKECGNRGFTYAGLQYGQHCFCGNEFGKSGKSNNCNMSCAGNRKEKCGGPWANSVWTSIKQNSKNPGQVKTGITGNYNGTNQSSTMKGQAHSDISGIKPAKKVIHKKISKVKNIFEDKVSKQLQSFNQKLSKAIEDYRVKQKQINYNAFNVLPSSDQIATHVFSSVPNNGKAHLIDLSEYEALPQKIGETIRLQKKGNLKTSTAMQIKNINSNIMLPQKPVLSVQNVSLHGISSITSFPDNNIIEPGDWVFVSGTGFGNTPGNIKIEYKIIKELKREIIHTLPITQHKHQLKWKDNFISFRLPILLQDLDQDNKKAALSISLANGKVISQSIKLKLGEINISDIWTDSTQPLYTLYSGGYPKDHWERFHTYPPKTNYFTRMPDEMQSSSHIYKKIVRSLDPGSEVYIMGSGFTNIPGEIEIMVEGKKLPITNIKWTNEKIKFKVGKIPNLNHRKAAQLTIRTVDGKTFLDPKVHFVYGPEMAVKVVSGIKWLEFEKDEDADFAETDSQNLVLFASHHPGCGWLGLDGSESGWDRFFTKNKELPKGVILRNFVFIELADKDAHDQWKFFKQYLENVLLDIESFGPVGFGYAVIKENLKMAAGALIDSIFGDGGSYHAYIPNNYPGSNQDSPEVGVKWENACTGPAKGLPISYTTSFTISGPKEILEGI